MVATRLSEVTNKGIDWAYSGGNGGRSRSNSTSGNSTSATVTTDDNDGRYMDDYFRYASDSVQFAVDNTRAGFAGLVSNLYTTKPVLGSASAKGSNTSGGQSSSTAASVQYPQEQRQQQRQQSLGSSASSVSSVSLSLTPPQGFKYPSMDWMLKNPYNSVRGRHESRSSLSAVRSLIPLITVQEDVVLGPVSGSNLVSGSKDNRKPYSTPPIGGHGTNAASVTPDIGTSRDFVSTLQPLNNNQRDATVPKVPSSGASRDRSSESASQLAEGTVRALRDLLLEESLDLRANLRFWTVRWERPILSWLEAGPWGTYCCDDMTVY